MNNARAHSAGLLAFLKGLFAVRLRLILPLGVAAALLAVLSAIPAQAQDEPRAPSRLSARIVDAGVALRWSPPAEDAESVESYEILRRRPNRGESTFTTLVSDTGTTETTYTDTTATEPGARYTYRVKAIRAGVRSLWSRYATALRTSLVSNIGQSPSATAAITQQYAMGFRLGTHGQGYEISSVWIDLAAAPSSLTVSLWIGSHPGHTLGGAAQRKLFEFTNPDTFQVGLNRFTAPAGAFAYPNINHYIVLSGFNTSLSIKETTSDAEDPGGEPGAILLDNANVRPLGTTGMWQQQIDQSASDTVELVAAPTTRASVLRLAVEGSRRDRGVLGSSFAQPWASDLETISLGNTCCFEFRVGAADRYLIRGLAVLADEANMDGGFFGIPMDVKQGSDQLFSLAYTTAQGDLISGPRALTSPAGISEWAAPQGATVAGGTVGTPATYNLSMVIRSIEGDNTDYTRGGVVFSRIFGRDRAGVDDPTIAHDAQYYDTSTPGVTFSSTGDVLLEVPHMAVLGEPLHAMVSNLGQTNSGYIALGTAANQLLFQDFETGSNPSGYRLQGIGVSIGGSDDEDGNAQIPDGPSSVAVYDVEQFVALVREPVDLVSPAAYEAAGVHFFEAPPGTVLLPKRTYRMIWSHLGGEGHRLNSTTSFSEDSSSLTGFDIHSHSFLYADIDNLTANVTASLSMAVYGEAIEASPLEYQVTKDWFHIPDSVEVGDQFRVVFVTFEKTDAESVDIEHYNDIVQRQAAQEENDRIIKGIAADFKAVVCTETVDARTNTQMGASQGVPVHWLDGGFDDHPTLIANSYDGFYDGEWVNEEVGSYVWGNSAYFQRSVLPVWTGCDAAGFPHPAAHMGTDDSMRMAALGTPGNANSNFGPLGAVEGATNYVSAEIHKHRPVLAISPILTVVERR